MTHNITAARLSHIDTIALLQQQKAQADALFFSIGDGAISSDNEGRIERINKTALSILGYAKSSEVQGKWIQDILVAVNEDGSLVDPMERPITQAFITGQPISKKMYYRTKTDEIVPVYVTVSPILMDNRPLGAVEVFRDITKEQEIDRMKSEFISIASHQLRTPLSAIKTYSHLISSGFEGELSDGQKQFMDIILTSVDRMNELINTLLNVSRIESGKIRVDIKNVNLNKLIDTLVKEVTPMAFNKQIKIIYKPPKEQVITRTDPLLISEIYTNLLSNALKYTPENGTVWISLRATAGKVVFSVKDTGYGIPEAMHARVFTKFFRSPNIIPREANGNGLGLYMVNQLSEALGGKIWFESQEGEGSTFYFALGSKKQIAA